MSVPAGAARLVQFIHPGGEHEPSANGRDWNGGKHRRIFLRSPGSYIQHDGTRRDGVLVLWAEWEAEAELIRSFDRPNGGGPRHLFTPYYQPRHSYLGLQNTDPFVFGDHFHYAGCQQYRKGHPTQLQRLPRGSVILFGSRLDKTRFVLDTVLVVQKSIEHSYAEMGEVRQQISATYDEVTLRPWYAALDAGLSGNSTTRYRLYWGATPDEPINGMFSFFPTLAEHEAPAGFPRPTIRLDRAITDHLSQGFKITQATAAEIRRLWESVCVQVHEQGLHLGTAAALPQRHDFADEEPRASSTNCGPGARGRPLPARPPAVC